MLSLRPDFEAKYGGKRDIGSPMSEVDALLWMLASFRKEDNFWPMSSYDAECVDVVQGIIERLDAGLVDPEVPVEPVP